MIREASGGKSFNTLEISARMILFKPYLALSATDATGKHAIEVASAETHTGVVIAQKTPRTRHSHIFYL